VCAYEQGSEYNEGTPTYVEVLAGKPVADITDGLRQANVSGKWASYRRFYFTGAAIALVLDRLLPDWQDLLAQGGRTLDSILEQALAQPLSQSLPRPLAQSLPQSLTQPPGGTTLPEASAVLKDMGYEAVLAAERASEAERMAKVDSICAEITQGPGFAVEIEIPDGAFTLFDPTNVIVVKPGVRLHSTIVGIRGSSGIVVDVSRLCLEDSGSRTLLLRLPAPPQVISQEPFRLSGEGLSVAAIKGWLEGPDSSGKYKVRF